MENHNFQIVKYKKKNKFEYEVVPSSWVIGTKVYFPKNNMNTMIQDPETKPDVDNWLSYQMARIKRAGYVTYYEAVNKLEQMLEEYTTDTEGQANVDNHLKTRSMKHKVSHAANRYIQLQMPPDFQKVGSKIPINNSPEMEAEPRTPEMENTTEYLEDNEHAGTNSSLYQYELSQQGTQGHHYVVLQDQDVHAQTSIPATPVTNYVGTPLSVQKNFTSGETFIISQLRHLSTKLIDLTNAVNAIMSSLEKPNDCRNQSSSFKILAEEKIIQNKAGLVLFEEQTDEWKKQLRLECLARIGKRQPTDVRSCCLELCDLLIWHEFWQYTSWAGGTKDEKKPKFALQEHHIFLNFFKDIVRETTDASFSDKEFAGFFQTKMKNRNQLPTKLKRAASRNRNPKKKRLEIPSSIEKHEDVEFLETQFQ